VLLATGIFLAFVGVAMIVGGVLVGSPALIGLLAGGLSCLASGAFMIYLDFPDLSR
jgi:hypothetical protein